MSQMIPNFIDYKVKSSAEERIFKWFRDNPATKDWTVLYSQTEVNHPRLIVGESDFIVLAPRKGIFVLEVKGGRVGRDDEGMWHFVNKNGQENIKARGPFEQAQEGMYSLKRFVEDKDPSLRGLLWGYGVMVPDMERLNVATTEFSPSMVFTKNLGNRVDTYIATLSRYNAGKFEEVYGREHRLPDLQQCKRIKELLRPSFDLVPSMASLIGEAMTEQIQFTKEQFIALDANEYNPRCLFVGGAGTGKTLLAKEIVRRSQGRNIGFVCFNKKLAEWVQRDFEIEGIKGKCAFVGDFHSLMSKNIKKAGLENRVNWENDDPFSPELFEVFFDSLALCPISFDSLIVDELQDLLDDQDNFFLALDSVLSGGLERGKFSFFGDFDNQSIYHPFISQDEALVRLQKYTFFTVCKLTTNCRNTPEICSTISDLTGVKYKAIRLKPSHLETKFIQYGNEEEEKKKLDQLLENFSTGKEKIKPNDVIILSPRSRKNSIVREYSDAQIENFSIPKGEGVSFSTIHAFKGLESPVVILVDVDSYQNVSTQNNESLIYVGVSRAQAKLYIFESKNAVKERICGLGGQS